MARYIPPEIEQILHELKAKVGFEYDYAFEFVNIPPPADWHITSPLVCDPGGMIETHTFQGTYQVVARHTQQDHDNRKTTTIYVTHLLPIQ